MRQEPLQDVAFSRSGFARDTILEVFAGSRTLDGNDK